MFWIQREIISSYRFHIAALRLEVVQSATPADSRSSPARCCWRKWGRSAQRSGHSSTVRRASGSRSNPCQGRRLVADGDRERCRSIGHEIDEGQQILSSSEPLCVEAAHLAQRGCQSQVV